MLFACYLRLFDHFASDHDIDFYRIRLERFGDIPIFRILAQTLQAHDQLANVQRGRDESGHHNLLQRGSDYRRIRLVVRF